MLDASFFFGCVAIATAVGAVAHRSFPAAKEQHSKLSGWRQALGKLLESHLVLTTVVVLLLTDLAGTAIKAHIFYRKGAKDELFELIEQVGFACLIAFFLEQLLHLLAFGGHFFDNPWFVLDLIVVSLTIVAELQEEKLEDYVNVLKLLRLWKLGVFVFDVILTQHEEKEAKEAKEANEEKRD